MLRGHPWLLLAVALLAVVSHLPALWGDLVYDDLEVILEDESLRSWSTLPEVLTQPTIAFSGRTTVYRPVSSVSWGLDLLTWGRGPDGIRAWPFHATNLLLHAMVAVLLAIAVAPFVGARSALTAAALFAVHPATVEDIAWVVGRADVLAVLLALGAVLSLRLSRPALRVTAVAAFALLAYGAKEIAFLLPGVMCLLIGAAHGRERRGLVPAALVTAGLLVGFFAWHHHLVSAAPGFPVLFDGASLAARGHVALSVIAVYARLLVWPHPLTVEYFWPGEVVPPWLWLGGLAVVAGSAAAFLFRRTRAVGVWLCLSLAGLLPVIHLMPFFELIAERYLYVPAIGVTVVVALGLERLRRTSPAVASGTLTALLAIGTALCLQQSTVWLSSISLFEHAVRYAPESVLARTNLATSYVAAGRLDDAAAQWQALVEVDPDNRDALFNLARWRHLHGDDDGARTLLGVRQRWLGEQDALELWDALERAEPTARTARPPGA